MRKNCARLVLLSPLGSGSPMLLLRGRAHRHHYINNNNNLISSVFSAHAIRTTTKNHHQSVFNKNSECIQILSLMKRQAQLKNFHTSLSHRESGVPNMEANNVNRLHFSKTYWIYEQYRKDLEERLASLKSYYAYDTQQANIKRQIDRIQAELDHFDICERQFNQKVNRLQYQIDALEMKKETNESDILHCEMMISHIKNEFKYAKSDDVIHSLTSRLQQQEFHLENLRETHDSLLSEIANLQAQIDSYTMDFIDGLELALDGKITFWKYHYPTVLRVALIAALVSFIASYLYHAVGVSIELRIGGDDDEEDENEDGQEDDKEKASD
nr:unnamed protein product [Naegleria fowleri]